MIRDFLAALGLYATTSFVVYFGFLAAGEADPVAAAFHFDSGHYLRIAEHGYEYDPAEPSNVAFYPGYPLLGRAVAEVTGCSVRVGLFVVAQVAFIAALTFFSAVLRGRSVGWAVPTNRSGISGVGPGAGIFRDRPKSGITGEGPGAGGGQCPPYGRHWASLLCLALWPPGICFRAAYSESLLLAALAALMLGFTRRWPPLILALIAGAATGIRAVGVAASLAVFVHILLTKERQRFLKAAALAPVACWGLLGYMLFQAVQFGEPLAFLQTQQHWTVYTPEDRSPIAKTLRLAIAEPIWRSYDPSSQRHWAHFNEGGNPLLGSAFWNPILFALAGVLVVLGGLRRWLSREELILGLGLLLIPYVSRADEQSMLSHARFAAVALPMYVVMGELLGRVPPAVRLIVFALLAVGLGLWAQLFAVNAPLL